MRRFSVVTVLFVVGTILTCLRPADATIIRSDVVRPRIFLDKTPDSDRGHSSTKPAETGTEEAMTKIITSTSTSVVFVTSLKVETFMPTGSISGQTLVPGPLVTVTAPPLTSDGTQRVQVPFIWTWLLRRLQCI